MLITTTPLIEGWEIKEYLGLVTSRVVAGTGFFKDIGASITDLIGGRSDVYQDELNSTTSETIELLVDETTKIGGNAVVGVRIDYGQKSGKGVQMFMVTATGTGFEVE